MDHIIVPELASFERDWHFSHAVRAGGLVLLSGVTGVGSDGTFSRDPAAQFHDAFAFLELHLRAAGLGFGDLAEITTYHVGLHQHMPIFASVKDVYLTRPYPAWTAIGVTELITPGAVLEIRAVAQTRATGLASS